MKSFANEKLKRERELSVDSIPMKERQRESAVIVMKSLWVQKNARKAISLLPSKELPFFNPTQMKKELIIR